MNHSIISEMRQLNFPCMAPHTGRLLKASSLYSLLVTLDEADFDRPYGLP